MFLRGQSAIEYLMTYGWMLLVVAIVGGAIFSIADDQNIESVSGFAGSDIQVENFGVDSHNRMVFELRNTASDDVEINQVAISGPEKERVYPINNSVPVSENGLAVLPDMADGSGSNTYEVEISYSTGGLTDLNADGSVTTDHVMDDTWESMVGYFPLDEANAEVAYDYTGNVPYGDIDENVSMYQPGVVGESYYFNDTHVTIDDNELLDPKNSGFSVTSWVKYNGTYNWARIISKARWGSLDDANGWHIQKWRENISFVVSNGSSHERLISDNINDGEWHFVAGRWNSTHLKMGVDNRTFGPVRYQNSGPIENDYPLVFGASAAPYKQDYFHGNIDEVRIYNKSITDEKIQEIRNKR